MSSPVVIKPLQPKKLEEHEPGATREEVLEALKQASKPQEPKQPGR